MKEEKPTQAVSWTNLAPVIGGVLLLFLILKLSTPSAPPPSEDGEYTFQPEPRPAPANLGASSGLLSQSPGSTPATATEAASCASLQQFANNEYAKRYRNGKLKDLMVFRGFEPGRPSFSAGDQLSCFGGEFIRKGSSGNILCKNVILTYNIKTNTLSYNMQYAYLERGLQPECSIGS
jgi:hypothetical protein